jgi:hypothetical protein
MKKFIETLLYTIIHNNQNKSVCKAQKKFCKSMACI